MRHIRLLALATCLLCLAAPSAVSAPEDGVDVSNADRCDFLDPALCLYPFSNDGWKGPARRR